MRVPLGVSSLLAVLTALTVAACAAPEAGAEVSGSGAEGLEANNGLKLDKGLKLDNGLSFEDGVSLKGGGPLEHGLGSGQGLDLAYGLAGEEGLSSTTGLVASEAGQTLLRYMVECALPAGQSVIKNDPVHGGQRTFNGFVGLAPEWRTGACGRNCQEWVSACLLARANALGQSVSIELVANHPAIGPRRTKPLAYPLEEAGFHGNLFLDPPQAYACLGLTPLLPVLQARLCGLATPLTCGFGNLVEVCALLGECSGRTGDAYVGCKNDAGTPQNTITTYTKLL